MTIKMICGCTFIRIGVPFDQSTCDGTHRGRFGCDECGCTDYRPSARPSAENRWPLCVCLHSAQEHNDQRSISLAQPDRNRDALFIVHRGPRFMMLAPLWAVAKLLGCDKDAVDTKAYEDAGFHIDDYTVHFFCERWQALGEMEGV